MPALCTVATTIVLLLPLPLLLLLLLQCKHPQSILLSCTLQVQPLYTHPTFYVGGCMIACHGGCAVMFTSHNICTLAMQMRM
jgi:hypothetical protein